MYFLASDHAVGHNFGAKLVKLCFDPIFIDKSKSDSHSVREIIKRIKAGASVCVFAEGNRSFNGVTCPIPPSTGKLIKISRADLITFRIEGGYFSTPCWAKTQRSGKTVGRFIKRYTSDELKKMSVSQINNHIEEDIYEDAYERQKTEGLRFVGKKLAENIETALYLCVVCEKIGTIKSLDNSFFCDCGFRAVYTETGLLSGDDLPFFTITEWDRWQSDKLVDVIGQLGDRQICSDDGQRLYASRAIPENLVGTGSISISRKTFKCAGHEFPIEQIVKVAVVGQMTLLFSLKNGDSYEVQSDAPRSAVKYREIFKVIRNSEFGIRNNFDN
jgi:hypothetical protein